VKPVQRGRAARRQEDAAKYRPVRPQGERRRLGVAIEILQRR